MSDPSSNFDVIPIGIKFYVEGIPEIEAQFQTIRARLQDLSNWGKQTFEKIKLNTFMSQPMNELLSQINAVTEAYRQLGQVASQSNNIIANSSKEIHKALSTPQVSQEKLSSRVFSELDLYQRLTGFGLDKYFKFLRYELTENITPIKGSKLEKGIKSLLESPFDLNILDDVISSLKKGSGKLSVSREELIDRLEGFRKSIFEFKTSGSRISLMSPRDVERFIGAFSETYGGSERIERTTEYLNIFGVQIDNISQHAKKAKDPFVKLSDTIDSLDLFIRKIGVDAIAFAKAFPQVGEIITIGGGVKDVEKLLKAFTVNFEGLGKEQQEIISKYWSMRGFELEPIQDVLKHWKIGIGDLARITPNLETLGSSLFKSMGTIRAFAESSMLSLKDMSTIFPELGLEITKGIKPDVLLAKLIKQTAMYETLNEDARTALRNFWSSRGIPIQEAIEGANALLYGTKELSTGMKEMQGRLGLAGMSAMLFGRQMLWVGLGTMFLNMSLQRVYQSQLKVRQSALSLLKSELSLQEQKKSLKETLAEYGAGTEEGRKAIRQYNLAVEESKLAHESLVNSIRMENMMYVQLYSSLIGQVIGMGTMLATPFMMLDSTMAKVTTNMEMSTARVTSALGAMSSALGGISMQETLLNVATAENTAITQKNIATTLAQAESKNISQTATQMQTQAELKGSVAKELNNTLTAKGIGLSAIEATSKGILSRVTKLLTGAIWGENSARFVSIMLQNLLIGALIMGVTMLASYAFTEFMTSIQTQELESKTKSLKQSIDKLRHGSGVYSLNEEIEKYKENLRNVSRLTTLANYKTEEFYKTTLPSKIPIEQSALKYEAQLPMKIMGYAGEKEVITSKVTNVGNININIGTVNAEDKKSADDLIDKIKYNVNVIMRSY